LSLFGTRCVGLALAIAFLFLSTSTMATTAAAAEIGWVRSYIRLNLRAGAGTEFKVLGRVETGNALKILSRHENWTRVETEDGRLGWIPAGYLEMVPPPTLRLPQLETETATLRTALEEIRSEANQLRESNATLAATDSGQREEIEALKIDNYELRAGSRYQEWITGALIVALSMLVGAFLQRNSARRPSTRVRL
jgi:SH3 domain protein